MIFCTVRVASASEALSSAGLSCGGAVFVRRIFSSNRTLTYVLQTCFAIGRVKGMELDFVLKKVECFQALASDNIREFLVALTLRKPAGAAKRKHGASFIS